MKEYLNYNNIDEYINKKAAKSTYQFIVRFLLFVLLLFLFVYFVYEFFPIYEFSQKCQPIFPILSKFLKFLCSPIGRAVVVIDALLGFFIVSLNKLKHIK